MRLRLPERKREGVRRGGAGVRRVPLREAEAAGLALPCPALPCPSHPRGVVPCLVPLLPPWRLSCSPCRRLFSASALFPPPLAASAPPDSESRVLKPERFSAVSLASAPVYSLRSENAAIAAGVAVTIEINLQASSPTFNEILCVVIKLMTRISFSNRVKNGFGK